MLAVNTGKTAVTVELVEMPIEEPCDALPDLTLGGYLIGDLQTTIHYLIPSWNTQFSVGHHPSTVTMLPSGNATRLVGSRYFGDLGV